MAARECRRIARLKLETSSIHASPLYAGRRVAKPPLEDEYAPADGHADGCGVTIRRATR
jgi:hypothetical protein